MNFEGDRYDHIKDIKESFIKVERLVKKYNFETEALFQPTNNQLRYASNHLLQAITTQNEKEFQEEIINCQEHIRRAFNDIFDALMLYYFDKIKVFVDDYRDVVVTDVIADYSERRSRLDCIKEVVEDSLAISELIVPPISVMLCQLFRGSLCQFR